MKPTSSGTLTKEEILKTSRSDARWRLLMALGNDAFCANNLDKALALYLEGMEEAENLLRLALDGVTREDSDSAPALVVATSNADNVYIRQSQHENARAVLQNTTTFPRTAIADEAAPQRVRMTCLQHINRALSELTGHMERTTNAGQDDIAREGTATKDLVGICLTRLKTKSFH